MITVQLNEANFEYDIHSLIKAFFPGEDVLVSAENLQEKEGVSFPVTISYKADRIELAIYKSQSELVKGIQPLQQRSAAVLADRKETKNSLKQALYLMLEAYTGQTLPWGTLTGIRPTKIPMALLEEGKTKEEIREYMKQTYFASDEKIELAIAVAAQEKRLLEKIDYENGYSIYIGIPFCPSTCLYCSFTSFPLEKWKDRVEEYLDALDRELEFTARHCRDKVLNSIYIGGGTPTTLTPKQLERLILKIKSCFDFSALLEFTVEAGRPDSITREKLLVLREQGVSRISINPQTMQQKTLEIIGRRHTVEQTMESFWLARELGFRNINMDLIVGLPNETEEDVKDTMEKIKGLDPDNLTVHSLAVKRAARLNMFREEYTDLAFTNSWEILNQTARGAKEMGMEPYYLYRQKNMAGNFENVGYARPGKAGLYNILIMEEKQTIIALGAGASSKFVLDHGKRIERVESVKDIANYLARTDEMIEKKRKKMEELAWH